MYMHVCAYAHEGILRPCTSPSLPYSLSSVQKGLTPSLLRTNVLFVLAGGAASAAGVIGEAEVGKKHKVTQECKAQPQGKAPGTAPALHGSMLCFL